MFADSSRRIAEADSVAVVGLGRFGRSLALELMASGTEVLGIDADEEIVQSLNGELTQVVRADSTKEEVLRQLAVPEFERVVLAIGDDVQASILTASLLLNMKVPVLWAKAVTQQHGLILEQLGAHHVIYPETDMGRRVAHLVRGRAMDYLEVGDGFAIVKTVLPERLAGMKLSDTTIRKTHGIMVSAYQRPGGGWHNAWGDSVIPAGATILVVGPAERVEAFAQLV